MDKNAFVIHLDPDYRIVGTTPVGYEKKFLVGKQIIFYLDKESYPVFFDMQREINEYNYSQGSWITLSDKDQYIFNAIKTDSGIELGVLKYDSEVSTFFHDILDTANKQSNIIRKMYETLSKQSNDGEYLQEIMKLNNELINAQRNINSKNRELKIANDKLEKMIFYDFLTNMRNRRGFFHDVYDFIESEDYRLIMIDFNNFKIINDELGHEKGDECLIAFALKMKSLIRPYEGMLYRLGGDEFIVLISAKYDFAFLKIVEQVDSEMQKIHPQVSLSFGETVVEKGNSDIVDHLRSCMSKADKLMYAYKKIKKSKSY